MKARLMIVLAAAACSEELASPPVPLKLAFVHPFPPLQGAAAREPNLEWALEKINAAGGRELVIDTYDAAGLAPEALRVLIEELAADESVLGVIGPGGSPALFDTADLFLRYRKLVIAPLSTSADLLRAYGGSGVVWRTRESDIAQVELLVRYAKAQNASRIALVTTLDINGFTFFSWFGFFAKELGYPEEAVTIAALPERAPCEQAMATALAARPELLFVAAGARMEELACIARAGAMSSTRIVFADTGFDPFGLRMLGPIADRLEGFSSAGSEEYERMFVERFGNIRVAPHGASIHDAALLFAYALERSGGRGGEALIEAMKDVVDGREPSAFGWDAAGVRATLDALRAGGLPDLSGGTGPLEYEPELYVDLASSTLTHWRMGPMGPINDQRYFTDDSSFLTSRGALVQASEEQMSMIGDGSAWAPPAEKEEVWAVIAALSSGWENYRHQASALRQYDLLKSNGVDDEHIILILADDIASAPENSEPGVVRNEVGGPNLYRDVVVDYHLELSGEDLMNMISGRVSKRTPIVLQTQASSNLLLYFAGHGGENGVSIGATNAAEGLTGRGLAFTPEHLRQALCNLRTENRVRRALVIIESCYGGVFGDVMYGGAEAGCGSMSALDGVALITAANSRESSYAGSYDPSLGAWISDAFSEEYSAAITRAPNTNLAQLYADVYVRVPGSHASFYNAPAAGRVSMVEIREFLTPR